MKKARIIIELTIGDEYYDPEDVREDIEEEVGTWVSIHDAWQPATVTIEVGS